MIVRYSIANYCNFKELQTISFEPSRMKDDRHIIPTEDWGRLLNMAMLYGPNSAGKSNFIRSLDYFRDFVLNGDIEDKYVSFLNKDGSRCGEPTYMEITLKIAARTFSYGFQCDSGKGTILAEWLLEESGKRTKKLFEYIDGSKEVKLGRKKMRIEGEMKHSTLNWIANSENYIEGLSEVCNSIYRWFKDKLIIVGSKEPDITLTASKTAIDDLNAILDRFDLDITRIFEVPFTNNEIPVNLYYGVKNQWNLRYQQGFPDTITLIHGNDLKRSWLFHSTFEGGKWVHRQLKFVDKSGHVFDFGSESLGAGRVLFILALFEHLKAIKDEGIFLAIDELECSIHSLNTCALISLYQEYRLPKAQLLISTHETQLLREDYTRKDEVWIADPRHVTDEGSEIYPMNSYNVRSKNYADPYLDGRFGGVPFISRPDLESGVLERNERGPKSKDTPNPGRSDSNSSSLLQFRVRNFLSIRDEVVLEMNLCKNGLDTEQLIDADSVCPKKIMALFGWNGCGKSSIVKAIDVLRNLVTDPYFSTKEKISYWNGEYRAETEFGIAFSINDTIFDYTVEVVPVSMNRNKGPYTYRTVHERLKIIDGNGPHTVFEHSKGNEVGTMDLDSGQGFSEFSDAVSSEDFLIADLARKMKENNRRLNKRIGKLNRRLDSIKEGKFKGRELPNSRQRSYDIRKKIDALMMEVEQNNALLDRIANVLSWSSPTLLSGDPRGIGLRLTNDDEGVKNLIEFETYRSKALGWFQTSLVVIGTDDYVLPLETDAHLDGISKILYSLDTGIERLSWFRLRLGKNDFRNAMSELSEKEARRVYEAFKQSEAERKSISLVAHGNREIYRFEFSPEWIKVSALVSETRYSAENADGDSPKVKKSLKDLYNESDGTLRILDISSIFLPTSGNKVFVVDEIDRRLHPEVTKRLIEMFRESSTEGNQLVFTTHESRLMSTKYLDVSEIALMEKVEDTVDIIPMDFIRFGEYDKSLESIYNDILTKSG